MRERLGTERGDRRDGDDRVHGRTGAASPVPWLALLLILAAVFVHVLGALGGVLGVPVANETDLGR